MSASIPSWVVRGAKVVCVRVPRSRRPGTESLPEPEIGKVYTLDGWIKAARGGVWVGLDEMDTSSAFELRMLRPLVTDKSEAEDMALFRHHLDQKTPESV